MSETKPTDPVARRDQGLALADALLQSNRRFQPLPAVAHERVKRRLRARLLGPAPRRVRWLRPLVIAGSLLLWGTAFGIAIDHFVFEHRLPPSPQGQPAAAPARPRARRSRPRPAREITVGDDQAPPSEVALPQAIAAPAVEPALPTPSVTISPPLASSARPRNSHSAGLGERPARAPVAFVDRATTISVPVTAAHAQGEHLPATGSTTRKTWPAPLPEVAIPAPAATAPVVPPPPARPPEKAVVAADTMTEERLLAAAVRSLRAKRDAASALVALDAYRSRYPQGRMSVEANVLRVDALTALDRQPEALRALDELDLGRIPGGSERRLQRGELRAASGRLREALPDFDDVLSQAREPSLMERALAGRTQARQRLGDLAGARLDANEYLRRFPDGPFARQARDIAQVSP